jgi:hypothetical protein
MLSKIYSLKSAPLRNFTSSVSSPYSALLHDLTKSVKFDSQNRIASLPEDPYELDESLDHAPKRTHSLSP